MQFIKKLNKVLFVSLLAFGGCGNDDDNNQPTPPVQQPVATPSPVLGAVSPAKGPSTGGTVLTMTGSGYTPETKVTFGDNATAATKIQFISSEELRVTTPTGSVTGNPTKITITNADGKTDSNSTLFRYAYGQPGFTAVTPALKAGTSMNLAQIQPGSIIAIPLDQGKTALVTANIQEKSIGIIKQDAMGNWQNATSTQVNGNQGQPVALATADVTGDGKMDLLVADAGNAKGVWLFIGDGLGGFTKATGMGMPQPLTGLSATPVANSMVIADLDGDGKLDIATAVNNVPMVGTGIRILKGDTTPGNFVLVPTLLPIGLNPNPQNLVAGDFNHDGKMDLAYKTPGNDTIFVVTNLNSTSGTIAFSSPAQFNTQGVQNLVTGDFNGDGKLDLAASTQTNNTFGIKVLLNDGLGGFTTVDNLNVNMNLSLDAPRMLAAGDVDGDGFSDLTVINSNTDNLSLLISSGDGKLSGAHSNIPVGNGAVAIVSHDVNGDGKLDLAVANQTEGTVSLLIGQSQ